MSDGHSDVMQSVEDDSDGGYEYTYDSDDNDDDYSEQDEYMQIEEKVSSSLAPHFTTFPNKCVCTGCRMGVIRARFRGGVAEDRISDHVLLSTEALHVAGNSSIPVCATGCYAERVPCACRQCRS